MICLCSLPGVWCCLVWYLSLWAILSLFSCMVWGCVLVSLICMPLSRFPSNACWKDGLFPILCSCLLCQRLIDHRCLGLFLLGSCFCSIGLSVCFGTSTTVLMTVALSYCLKSGRVMPPAWFLFLRIALAILGPLWSHINVWIVCSSSVKTVMDNLIEIALNL